MLHRVLLAALGLALFFPSPGSAAEPSPLEGTWIEVLPDRPRVGYCAPRSPVTLVIAGNSIVERDNGRTVRQSLFRAAPGLDRKAIDLTTVVADEFWLTRAIYRVEGDALTICEGGRDKPRPSSFRRWEGIGDELTLLMTFKRLVAVPAKGCR